MIPTQMISNRLVRAALLFTAIAAIVGETRSRAAGEDARATPSAPTLTSRLEPLIRAHKGKVAIAVKNLKTGEEFHHRGAEVQPTASLIKFPVMVEAYRQAAEGKVDLDARITLRAEDKVPGSGILTDHFSAGDQIALKDAIRLMIMSSDNTATNLVLDAIGIGATAATMESMGYPNTKIHSKVFRRDTSVFPERSKAYGLGSTTADEMVRLLEALHAHRLASPSACDRMIEHLRTCDDRDKFPKGLPYGTKVAFKTGSVDEARTAAGLIDCPDGTVALCVLTCENQDRRWVPDNAGNVLCADVARAVFAHFSQPGAAPSAAR
ncbi:Beta-lactamase precursor [Aquisphaera giovannonii]|uniref:Beta-lactamase n=1 Tax=Aquisphaera giovannonii TaxID=406548 RepID=A0A5B9VZB5_9BACT|nr:serine hydrolase [Aquisphaera giovannonii]QEH33115.1 Beta-lactamase precursor [Aquisphaera giovannonii]